MAPSRRRQVSARGRSTSSSTRAAARPTDRPRERGEVDGAGKAVGLLLAGRIDLLLQQSQMDAREGCLPPHSFRRVQGQVVEPLEPVADAAAPHVPQQTADDRVGGAAAGRGAGSEVDDPGRRIADHRSRAESRRVHRHAQQILLRCREDLGADDHRDDVGVAGRPAAQASPSREAQGVEAVVGLGQVAAAVWLRPGHDAVRLEHREVDAGQDLGDRLGRGLGAGVQPIGPHRGPARRRGERRAVAQERARHDVEERRGALGPFLVGLRHEAAHGVPQEDEADAGVDVPEEEEGVTGLEPARPQECGGVAEGDAGSLQPIGDEQEHAAVAEGPGHGPPHDRSRDELGNVQKAVVLLAPATATLRARCRTAGGRDVLRRFHFRSFD